MPPEALTMGLVALRALAVNAGVALMLYAWREGDANMRSVWLCSRNDAIGNLAVGAAALGVFGTGSGWPDLLVAGVMGSLAISAGISVVRQARGELAQERSARALKGHPADRPGGDRPSVGAGRHDTARPTPTAGRGVTSLR